MRARRRAAGRTWTALLVVSSLAAACTRGGATSSRSAAGASPGGPAAGAPGTAASAPAAAALGTVTAGALSVTLSKVQRVSPSLLQLDLFATNGGETPIDLSQVLVSPAVRLDQASLTHSSGDARTFVVKNDQGQAQCSADLGTLPPGGRRPLFVRFVAFSADEFSATLELPGMAPFPVLTVPAAASPPAEKH